MLFLKIFLKDISIDYEYFKIIKQRKRSFRMEIRWYYISMGYKLTRMTKVECSNQNEEQKKSKGGRRNG